MCSTPFQCSFIGEKLNIARKFTAKQISGQILLVRCTSAQHMEFHHQEVLHPSFDIKLNHHLCQVIS